MSESIRVIDSHTAGEPTRVIIDGGPDLGSGPIKQRAELFEREFDRFRRAVVTEPRGSDVLVGALICEPHDRDCDLGVIFFNNVGFLGMCGHGMIGVAETLRYLDRLSPGNISVETPVGPVGVQLHSDGTVSIENVVSYRTASDVEIEVPGIGRVIGDVAWGGNVFFLVREPTFEIGKCHVGFLQQAASKIRDVVRASGFESVDHVELFANGDTTLADSRNFVLCPGLEYDRSPCGTGTSAKLACLAADGKLKPGQRWNQAGILGTRFAGTFQWDDEAKGRIRPTITGQAYVTAESRLIVTPNDPFGWGLFDRSRGDQTRVDQARVDQKQGGEVV